MKHKHLKDYYHVSSEQSIKPVRYLSLSSYCAAKISLKS